MIASFALGFAIRQSSVDAVFEPPEVDHAMAQSQPAGRTPGARIPMLQVVTIVDHAGRPSCADAVPQTHALRFRDRALRRELHYGPHALGVRANGVILLAFAISGMLAAAIGLILAINSGTADIGMGANIDADRLHRHGDRRSWQRAGSALPPASDRRRAASYFRRPCRTTARVSPRCLLCMAP